MKQVLLIIPVLFIIFTGCSRVSDKSITPPSDTIPANNINVILIVGDDIGYEIPTCDGGESYSTPNLDYLANNGIRFTQCYASPLCSPSRISLLTGKYNFRNYYNWGILNTNQLTLANLFKNNGYKTCYAGKWQLDGGDASITKFGFENYIVWLPFVENSDDENTDSRYKTPVLYTHRKYIASATVKGKYGEDIFTDSIEHFISANKQNKFFIYYAMTLGHKPFCPSPDDPDYALWDGTNVNHSDTKYFPSMVNYMDKKIGQLTEYLKQNRLDKNTVIMFIGDNGTPPEITSRFNGELIPGGKGHTYTYGTHVPFIVYWPGKISPAVNNNLISLPDFFPTLAELTHISISNAFKPIDGISFYQQFFGNYSTARNSLYNYYHYDTTAPAARWVQDAQFKLYDSTINPYHTPGFYDMQNDIDELSPISYSYMSKSEQATQQNFQHVLDSLK